MNRTMYHGTASEFSSFEFDEAGWFVDDRLQAWLYAIFNQELVGEGKPRVIEVVLHLDNPHAVTPKEMKEWSREPDADFFSRMKAKGYDSLIFPDHSCGDDIVVFDPSRIEIVKVHRRIPRELLDA